MLSARPIYNVNTKEWNILVLLKNKKKSILGYAVHDIHFEYVSFYSQDEAIKFITKDKTLKLDYKV